MVQPNKLFFTEARPEELTPHVMVLLAQHLARHRLREPQLLEAIAHFLVVQETQLSSKVGLAPKILVTPPLYVCLGWSLPPANTAAGPLCSVLQGPHICDCPFSSLSTSYQDQHPCQVYSCPERSVPY